MLCGCEQKRDGQFRSLSKKVGTENDGGCNLKLVRLVTQKRLGQIMFPNVAKSGRLCLTLPFESRTPTVLYFLIFLSCDRALRQGGKIKCGNSASIVIF